jgi:VWFA-related protein
MNCESGSGRKPLSAAIGIVAALVFVPASIGEESKDPVDLGLHEDIKVRMAVVDLVVLDKAGRTVPGLTADDFEITVHGREIPVASLDVDCPGGGAAEPIAAFRTNARVGHAPPQGARKIVLALDYLHLDQMQRMAVLERAKEMVEDGATADDQIMVVALTGGLRVEQPFDADRKRTLNTLHRMEYDITLWNGNFYHLTESGFMDGMNAMFDVLGEIPGPKAAVLFSAMGDVPLDSQFRQIAALAAGSRCAIYPVDARGLDSSTGARSSVSGSAAAEG